MRRMVGSAVVGNVGLSVEVGGRMRKIVGEWGCRLGGFPVGHDWWGGERVVGGVLPRICIGDGVCVTVYV